MRSATRVILVLSFFWTLPQAFAQLTGGKPPVLPPPYVKPVVPNPSTVSPAPGFIPTAPPGFTVSLFAKEFREPRWMAVAPNGDVFVADTAGGKVWVLHDPGHGAA